MTGFHFHGIMKTALIIIIYPLKKKKNQKLLLTLYRNKRTDISTIGSLYRLGAFQCYTLEDTDRHIYATESLQDIQQKKVQNETAIPYGTYEVTVNYSNHFGKNLPELLNVPCWSGVRIHSGNMNKDTEGCILVGLTTGSDIIYNSHLAFNQLYPVIYSASLAGDNIQIEILEN